MEVGPTTHYMMGGVRVDAETQMSTTVPGLFAAGECGAGLHGANRLGGNSLSDLLVFGKRAGEYAARFAQGNGAGKRRRRHRSTLRPRRAVAPVRALARLAPRRTRTRSSTDLQAMMQDLVGIVRREAEMERALAGLAGLRAAGGEVARARQPRVQPGLAHRARPAEPADRLRGHRPRRARAQGEPRRPVPRGLPREERRNSARSTSSSARASRRRDADRAASRCPSCRAEQKAIVEEMK